MTLLATFANHWQELNTGLTFLGEFIPTLEQAARLFHACDLHQSLYCSFGAVQLSQALTAGRTSKRDATREHGLHGLIYLALGLS